MSTQNYALTADKRDRAGKGVARALRREGKIPAVIYGGNEPPLPITVVANDINVAYGRGRMYNSLCEMAVDGKQHLVLARDVQVHPVTDVVMHADFLRVTDKTRIPVSIPVHFLNDDQSPGLRGGGILSVVRYEIELMCNAMDIPVAVEVDLAGTQVGDTIKISAVTLPAGTTPVIDDRDFSIASVVAPKKVVERTVQDDDEDADADEEAEGGDAEAGEAEGAES